MLFVSSPPPPVLSWQRVGPVKAICLGDSTSGEPGVTSPLGTTGGVGGAPQPTQLGQNWFVEFCHRSLGAVTYLGNAFVSGDTTSMMLNRLQADVIALAPDLCFCLMGTNDFSLTEALSRSNMLTIVQRLLAANIMPVLLTIPPRDDSTKHAQELRANAYIRYLARTYRLALVDLYGATVNPSTGQSASGMLSDGTHPTNAGIKTWAGQAISDLANMPWWQPQRNLLLPQRETDPTTIWDGSILQSVDSDSDGVADGWTKAGAGAGNCTTSLVTASGVPGKLQKMDQTVSGVTQLSHSTPNNTGFAVGDKMMFVCRLRTSGEAGSLVYSVKVQNISGSTPVLYPVFSWANDLADALVYYEWIVPSGTGRFEVDMRIESGVGNIQFGQLALYNLTNLGVA